MLVIDGRTIGVPGRSGVSFVSDPQLALGSRRDWRPRQPGTWVRGICVHTRMGLPVEVRNGTGPNLGWDKVLARRFTADDRSASAHIAIDADGSFGCLADLQRTATYHAGHVNEISIGIELYQAGDGGVWESTIHAAVDLIDVITREMGIQRQYALEQSICRRLASPTAGMTRSAKLSHVPGGARGRDWCGIYGHRNVTRNRGEGDPGDQVFHALAAAGYEGYRIDTGDDLDVWARRQSEIGVDPEECDGIPGRLTRRLIAISGRSPHGIWVRRPCDLQPDLVA